MARPNSTVKGERLKPQRAGLTDTNLLLIITLVVKPTGLFGEKITDKV